MQTKFDKLVESILNEDKSKEQMAGEHAGNFLVQLHKDGKLVKTIKKTFPNRSAATAYASACNKSRKEGEYYSAVKN